MLRTLGAQKTPCQEGTGGEVTGKKKKSKKGKYLVKMINDEFKGSGQALRLASATWALGLNAARLAILHSAKSLGKKEKKEKKKEKEKEEERRRRGRRR